MTVLTFVKHYLPGYKSGGPVRSLANLVGWLGEEFRFVVLAWDRDSLDERPYPGIEPGKAYRLGKADVIYLHKAQPHFLDLARVIRRIEPDVLYLNSFFCWQFSLVPLLLRRLRLIPQLPVILAPRGEFSPGALGLKTGRKRAFLAAAATSGLHDDVIWQASSPLEESEIRRCIERSGRIVVARDLAAPLPQGVPRLGSRKKTSGCLRVVFLSRLTRKKNLLGALEILKQVTSRIEFYIYGTLRDPHYWAECQTAIAALPSNVTVHYMGAIEHTEVHSVLEQYDVFFLPTLGENYGHVILEGLLAGCPVLISDQTPWQDLTAAGVGWDLPLVRPDAFRSVLEQCAAMDAATFAEWSARAVRYGMQKAADPEPLEANRRLLGGCRTWKPVATSGSGP